MENNPELRETFVEIVRKALNQYYDLDLKQRTQISIQGNTIHLDLADTIKQYYINVISTPSQNRASIQNDIKGLFKALSDGYPQAKFVVVFLYNLSLADEKFFNDTIRFDFKNIIFFDLKDILRIAQETNIDIQGYELFQQYLKLNENKLSGQNADVLDAFSKVVIDGIEAKVLDENDLENLLNQSFNINNTTTSIRKHYKNELTFLKKNFDELSSENKKETIKKMDDLLRKLLNKDENKATQHKVIDVINSKNNSDQFWWINANKDHWNILDLKIGSKHSYSTHNEEGNERRVFEHFFEAKLGDLVIGYESSPTKKVVAIFEITKTAKNRKKDTLGFTIIYYFKKQVKRDDLLKLPLFANTIIARNPTGSLFKLSQQEFLEIISQTELEVAVEREQNDIEASNLSKIAQIANDGLHGTDYLGTEKDVLAFAKIMAAKNFNPPLAIALFGKWGQGKSFFIEKLITKIDKLPKEYPLTYCSGVVQIKFNAWSYLDANLWASMVTQIFQNLDHYIKGDKASDEIKSKIEEELTNKLSISQEQQELLQKRKLEEEVKLDKLYKAQSKLNSKLERKIKEIRSFSFKTLLEKVNAEYNIGDKIKEALNANGSTKGLIGYLETNIPELHQNDPEAVLAFVNSRKTFLKAFFNKEKLFCNIMWFSVIIIIVSCLPYYLKNLTDWAKNTSFIVPQILFSGITLLAPVIKRYQKTYQKLQPIISSLWNIKEEYNVRIKNAQIEHEQEEKALKLEIQKKKGELEAVALSIQEVKKEINTLTFKIKNTLSTEALYSFIERRSLSEDYTKHLGIVSYIRKDFEILSDLLIEHRKESALGKLKKPIERIILYIDDLDRCSEERVIEVLEAVNLLMTFPLFIVVVGVDSRWVKNALIKKYQLQFTGQLNNIDLRHKVELIEAANYLEKIFQVPFHLRQANDQNIKDMLKELAKNKTDSLSPGEEKSEVVYEGPVTDLNDILDKTQIKELKDLLSGTTGKFEGQKAVESESAGQKEIEDSEYGILSEREIELIQEFSGIIGKNPRAVKRFINVYKIAKAHEELPGSRGNEDKRHLLLMLLLALPIGPFQKTSKFLYKNIYRQNNYSTISAFFAETTGGVSQDLSEEDKLNETLQSDLKNLESAVRLSKNGELLLNAHTNECVVYLDFIKRFTFADMP
jgi:hypothetical protein